MELRLPSVRHRPAEWQAMAEPNRDTGQSDLAGSQDAHIDDFVGHCSWPALKEIFKAASGAQAGYPAALAEKNCQTRTIGNSTISLDTEFE